MKKYVFLLFGIIAVFYSCKTQEKNKDSDPFLYNAFNEVGHTKYVYNTDKADGSYTYTEKTTEDGNTNQRQGECWLLPCGMVIEEEICNNGLLGWIISNLTDYEKAINTLKKTKHVKSPNSYSVNNSKHVITIIMNGASSFGFNYVYKLSYKNQYGYLVLSEIKSYEDEGYGPSEGGSIYYQIEDGLIISKRHDHYDSHDTVYYIYDDYERLLYSFEDYGVDIDTYSKKGIFIQYFFDETNKLKKTITTSTSKNIDVECKQEVTEYKYQEDKLTESLTQQRKKSLTSSNN